MSRDQLKALIKDKHISIVKLSHHVFLDPDTIRNYLKGKSSISADSYEKIETFLRS